MVATKWQKTFSYLGIDPLIAKDCKLRLNMETGISGIGPWIGCSLTIFGNAWFQCPSTLQHSKEPRFVMRLSPAAGIVPFSRNWSIRGSLMFLLHSNVWSKPCSQKHGGTVVKSRNALLKWTEVIFVLHIEETNTWFPFSKYSWWFKFTILSDGPSWYNNHSGGR